VTGREGVDGGSLTSNPNWLQWSNKVTHRTPQGNIKRPPSPANPAAMIGEAQGRGGHWVTSGLGRSVLPQLADYDAARAKGGSSVPKHLYGAMRVKPHS
jgi:hypothetical protein